MPQNPRIKTFKEPFSIELFLPEGEGPFPLICITPILGRFEFFDDLHFERDFARYYAQNGLAACIFDRPIFEFDPGQGLEQIQHYLENSIGRAQIGLDRLLLEKEIDPCRVGSFGMSFGAIANILWAARDPRLSANGFALPGGNLPEIFVTSRDPLMRSYLNAALKKSGLTKDALKDSLASVFKWDPLREAPKLKPETTYLILALFDRVVPYRLGLALKEKLGHPQTVFLPLGHYLSMFASPYIKPRIVKFFKEKLVRS